MTSPAVTHETLCALIPNQSWGLPVPPLQSPAQKGGCLGGPGGAAFPHHQQRRAGCVGSEQRAGPGTGQPRCAGDASRDRATLAGFLATVGAGCDQQQRSELSLVEPLDSGAFFLASWGLSGFSPPHDCLGSVPGLSCLPWRTGPQCINTVSGTRGTCQMKEKMPPYHIFGHPSDHLRHFQGYRGHAYKCDKIGRTWLWVISSPGFLALLWILLEGFSLGQPADCAGKGNLNTHLASCPKTSARQGHSLVLHCPPVSV